MPVRFGPRRERRLAPRALGPRLGVAAGDDFERAHLPGLGLFEQRRDIALGDADHDQVDVERDIRERRVTGRAFDVVVLGIDRRHLARIAVAQQVLERHRHETRVGRSADHDDRARSHERVQGSPRARRCARDDLDGGGCQTRMA